MLGLSYEKVATALVGWLAVNPDPSSSAQRHWRASGGELSRGHGHHHCPDYNDYSQEPHGPYSSGPLKLPTMRPKEGCRTFHSPAVEKVIKDMGERLVDPDLAQLFANTFPNTLDTTVRYFDEDLNLAFVITGDITAQWLRDTGNQFAHYYKLLPHDKKLQALVKAIINTEARYIHQYPYCGAFQPPPESGLPPSWNEHAYLVVTNPPVDNNTVFECKYELDSLAGFLKMSNRYYQYTKDSSFINSNWKKAVRAILELIHNESQSSWDEDFNFISSYNWTGLPGSRSPEVFNGGNGELRLANGLVGSSHRGSDDLCTFQYITAANAMIAVELDRLAAVLDEVEVLGELSKTSKEYAETIREAVMEHTITTKGFFAYETDGYGSQQVMDDANIPGLLSLSYVDFLPRDDPLFQKTRSAMLSRANPYYAEGKGFKGVGGPHVGATYAWPMSQISAIYGTDDEKDIKERLELLIGSTAGLGLIHESISIYDTSKFTRPWFAWVNSYFAEMILDLAERAPHLILNNSIPYVLGE